MVTAQLPIRPRREETQRGSVHVAAVARCDKRAQMRRVHEFGYHECRRIYAEPTPKATRKLIELIGSDDEHVALGIGKVRDRSSALAEAPTWPAGSEGLS